MKRSFILAALFALISGGAARSFAQSETPADRAPVAPVAVVAAVEASPSVCSDTSEQPQPETIYRCCCPGHACVYTGTPCSIFCYP